MWFLKMKYQRWAFSDNECLKLVLKKMIVLPVQKTTIPTKAVKRRIISVLKAFIFGLL